MNSVLVLVTIITSQDIRNWSSLQVVKGYSAGLDALKAELRKPELDAANVSDLMAEIGDAVADVGDVSRILATEENSDLGKVIISVVSPVYD